jgi:hypothetical protein
MPSIETSRFISFKLSEEEEKAAKVFTELNKMLLMSMRAYRANEKLNLIFDPTKPHEFLARDAYCRGQIELLDELIGD